MLAGQVSGDTIGIRRPAAQKCILEVLKNFCFASRWKKLLYQRLGLTLEFGSLSQDLLFRGLQHAVQASEDRHRKNDAAILVGTIRSPGGDLQRSR